jgi:cysteine synthase
MAFLMVVFIALVVGFGTGGFISSMGGSLRRRRDITRRARHVP